MLTAAQIQQAIDALPSHRKDLKRNLENTLDLVKRGIAIKETAPIWVQAQNVIFVSRVDVEISKD